MYKGRKGREERERKALVRVFEDLDPTVFKNVKNYPSL